MVDRSEEIYKTLASVVMWAVSMWELIKLFPRVLVCLNFYIITDQHLMCFFCSGKDPKVQAASGSSVINKEQLY